MKKLSLLFLLIPLVIASSLHAVMYPFPGNKPAYLRDEAVIKVGKKLYLFHSGTEDVKESIKINDVLTVYREDPSDLTMEIRAVGKVRILSTLGEYYFEGEVIEGVVLPGYIAKKGAVACYITSFKKSCPP